MDDIRERVKPQVRGYRHHPRRRKTTTIACKDRRCAKKIRASIEITIGCRLIWELLTLVHSLINSIMAPQILVRFPSTTSRLGCTYGLLAPSMFDIWGQNVSTHREPWVFSPSTRLPHLCFLGGTAPAVLAPVNGNCTQPSPPQNVMRTSPPRTTSAERMNGGSGEPDAPSTPSIPSARSRGPVTLQCRDQARVHVLC